MKSVAMKSVLRRWFFLLNIFVHFAIYSCKCYILLWEMAPCVLFSLLCTIITDIDTFGDTKTWWCQVVFEWCRLFCFPQEVWWCRTAWKGMDFIHETNYIALFVCITVTEVIILGNLWTLDLFHFIARPRHLSVWRMMNFHGEQWTNYVKHSWHGRSPVMFHLEEVNRFCKRSHKNRNNTEYKSGYDTKKEGGTWADSHHICKLHMVTNQLNSHDSRLTTCPLCGPIQSFKGAKGCVKRGKEQHQGFQRGPPP